jgi:hypothetical protein
MEFMIWSAIPVNSLLQEADARGMPCCGGGLPRCLHRSPRTKGPPGRPREAPRESGFPSASHVMMPTREEARACRSSWDGQGPR